MPHLERQALQPQRRHLRRLRAGRRPLRLQRGVAVGGQRGEGAQREDGVLRRALALLLARLRMRGRGQQQRQQRAQLRRQLLREQPRHL